ncbi:putative short-chain dehydrogenase/reductase family protein [Nemania abortiva]|nr:putative short-chain dehydrogenase/reductase family protein [Nemania abortiva]
MSSRLSEQDAIAESKLSHILYNQVFVRPKSEFSPSALAGETGIVAGSNSGVGFEAARMVLGLGVSRLILAVRSQTRGDNAARQLVDEFSSAEISVWILDLADYDSIIEFVDRCRSLDRLDFVIQVAGVQLTGFYRSEKTNHEMTMQTNYYGNALLVLLLVAVMKEKKRPEASKAPVISVVGSDTMYLSTFQTTGPILDQFDDQTRYSRFDQYRDSKLLLMMFISRLAQQISPDDVIINVSNPGLTYGTGLGKGDEKLGHSENASPAIVRMLFPVFMRAIGRPGKVGASAVVHGVVAGGRESHGSFVSDWEVKPHARVMYTQAGKDMSEKLWHETMEEFRGLGFDFGFTNTLASS